MNVFHAGFAASVSPTRVRFGTGARHDLSPELDALELSRVLVLTTAEQAEQGAALLSRLGTRGAGHFAGAVMHTPVEVTTQALAEVEAVGADGLVAVGGGSTVGLAKAIAYRTDLPQIVLPTTYAGSEATPVLGQTEDGGKTTLTSDKVRAEAIVYDPELTATLPVALSVTSGLNAMAHAVSGRIARDATPLSGALACAGIEAFVSGLPNLIEAPGDLYAREQTQFGAWLCGSVLAQVSMSLHHKLCHVLGGTLNLPHSDTHAILLPHTTAYNECVMGGALQPVARILGCATAAEGLAQLARRLEAPTMLRDLGVARSDLERVADLALSNPYWNPRPLERDALLETLERAWTGEMPETGGTA